MMQNRIDEIFWGQTFKNTSCELCNTGVKLDARNESTLFGCASVTLNSRALSRHICVHEAVMKDTLHLWQVIFTPVIVGVVMTAMKLENMS